LMWVTHVIRWDEWLASLNIAFELAEMLWFKLPIYAHISPIRILENNKKVKLSKRKHKEASLDFYLEKGYPKEAILKYLNELIESDYKKFLKYYKNLRNRENIKIKKLASGSWPLIDLQKIEFISKNILAKYSKEKLFEELYLWAKKFDKKLYDLINSNKDYFLKVLSIERWKNIISNPRKDLKKFSDFLKNYWYFFTKPEDIVFDKTKSNILAKFTSNFEKYLESREDFFWFIKNLADNNYKNIVTISNYIRKLLTWEEDGMDLFQIINIMWITEVKDRLKI
jgi:glutamyl-tRNA synthetase